MKILDENDGNKPGYDNGSKDSKPKSSVKDLETGDSLNLVLPIVTGIGAFILLVAMYVFRKRFLKR